MKIIFAGKNLKRKQITDIKDVTEVEIQQEENDYKEENQQRIKKSEEVKGQMYQSEILNRRSHQTYHVKSPTIFESQEGKQETKLRGNRKFQMQKNKNKSNKNVSNVIHEKTKNTITFNVTPEETKTQPFLASLSQCLTSLATKEELSSRPGSRKATTECFQAGREQFYQSSQVNQNILAKAKEDETRLLIHDQILAQTNVYHNLNNLQKKPGVNKMECTDNESGNSMLDVNDECFEAMTSRTAESYEEHSHQSSPVEQKTPGKRKENEEHFLKYLDSICDDSMRETIAEYQENLAEADKRKFSCQKSMLEVADEYLDSDTLTYITDDGNVDKLFIIKEVQEKCETTHQVVMATFQTLNFDSKPDTKTATNDKATDDKMFDGKYTGTKTIAKCQDSEKLGKQNIVLDMTKCDSFESRKKESQPVNNSEVTRNEPLFSKKPFCEKGVQNAPPDTGNTTLVPSKTPMIGTVNCKIQNKNRNNKSEFNKKKEMEKQKSKKDKKRTSNQQIALACAERYRDSESKHRIWKPFKKVEFYHYSPNIEHNYIMNYPKKLLNHRKKAGAYIRIFLQGPKQNEIFNATSDNMNRLFRFHLPLSFYHGLEED